MAFQLNHTDKSFHVFANSVADKNNWIANLRKNISKASQGKGMYHKMILKNMVLIT